MRIARAKDGRRGRQKLAILALTVPACMIAAQPARAACVRASTEAGKAKAAAEIYHGADVIIAGRVLKRLDIAAGQAEMLEVDELIKGRSPRVVSLWLPKGTDSLNTNESPTTGLAEGAYGLFPLRRRSGLSKEKLIIFECDAVALTDKDVAKQIRNMRVR